MLKYAFLGMVQGLTEFFPVSSKGHLVFLQHALGMRGDEVVLPVVLHLGTLVAVTIFLRSEVKRLFIDRRLLLAVVLSTVVTGAIGLAGKRFFEGLFLRPAIVAPGMLFTGIVLLVFGRNRPDNKRTTVGFADAFWAGLAQSLALVPGVSRSGMTVSSLLLRKMDALTCFSFSFLISIPAVLGASLLELKGIRAAAHAGFFNLAIGFVFSLVFGLAALALVKRAMIRDKFHYFGYYCLAMGLVLFCLR
jgi:undecaprenyl-diphosphatase